MSNGYEPPIEDLNDPDTYPEFELMFGLLVYGYPLWFCWNGSLTIRIFAQLNPGLSHADVIGDFYAHTTELTVITLGEPIPDEISIDEVYHELRDTVDRWVLDQDADEIRRLLQEAGIDRE